MNAPVGRVLDSFQSALLRIEQGLATWRDIRDCAQMDIGCLEHLMEEVQQGRMELCPLSDLPILPRPWRNITQMTSQLSSTTFEDYGRNPSIVSGSSVNSSPQGNDLGNVLPPTDTLTATSSLMAILTSISSPPDTSTQTLPPTDTLVRFRSILYTEDRGEVEDRRDTTGMNVVWGIQ